MITVNKKEIVQTTRALERLTKTAEKQLLELRVLLSLEEIRKGKFDVFDSGEALIAAAKK